MKADEKSHIIAIGWPYSLNPRLKSLWKWEVIETSAFSSRVNCSSISVRSELTLSGCALNIAEVIGMAMASKQQRVSIRGKFN